ncbi:MAG: hypothetical protein ACFE8U_01550 [Candidatus Hermodarchaeota archaeon]
MHNHSSSLLTLYRKAALNQPNELSHDLWGKIPPSYQVLKNMVENRQKNTNFSTFIENIEVFLHMATDRHRKLGTLSSRVKESLEQLNQGFLDLGHQPLLFGGSLFLINKVSFAEWLGNLLNIGAYFFIGDHDSIQNELTVTRFPQANSSSGLVITPSFGDIPEGTPMHQVPIPSEEWLIDVKQKIQDNLRLLLKMAKVRQEYRQLILERFHSGFDLIYDGAIVSNDFSHWTQLIWSRLFNIRNDLKIFISPSSDPRYRQLVLPAFEFLLTEKNRTRYVETLNQIYNLLVSQNIQPGLPYRESDYSPFFLECLKCEHNTRVQLQVTNLGVLEGKCPVCNEDYSFSYNPNRPDLSEIGTSITPRSDSRAVVNNITFPLLVHIGGSGETQYYSAVIPAMKRLKIDPPILIRSNRIYYNSPWAHQSASEINSPILGNDVYSIFDEYNSSKSDLEVRDSLEKMRTLLKMKNEKEKTHLSSQLSDLESNPRDGRLRKNIKRIELMLSHNYGRFTPGKKAQEVSWNWLDLAVLTGVHNICDIFKRQLKEEAYPGHTWYITPGKFT